MTIQNTQSINVQTKKRHKPRSSWIMYLYFVPNLLGTGDIVIRSEGSLEMLFILRLLMNPKVAYVDTNLESVNIDGRDRSYNTDVLFALSNGILHYNEIKNSRALNKIKTQVKLDQIAQNFAKQSVAFEIFDENDIAPGDTARNLLRLFHFYPVQIKIETINQILSLVNKSRSLESLIRACDKHRIENCRVAIWNMLAHKYLSVDDLSKYINANTLISVGR